MNSDDVNLTSSEISKAFTILRKYRYTFTPERTRRTKDAETTLDKKLSRESLPYLDLADTSRSKDEVVRDWVDSLEGNEEGCNEHLWPSDDNIGICSCKVDISSLKSTSNYSVSNYIYIYAWVCSAYQMY